MVRQAHHKRFFSSLLVATALVGLALNVLNVPDRVKPFFSHNDFQKLVVPRLSTGDQSLWTDFPRAVSRNSRIDALNTVKTFRELPTRPPGRTDLAAYDFVLLVPVLIDNVNPPQVARHNDLGIDIDADYREMLDRICRAYRARWHT